MARNQKIEKFLHRTVVSTHSQNFSIVAELEFFFKLGSFGGVLGPSKVGGRPDFKNLKKTIYRTVVRTHTTNFSTLALLGCIKTFHVREK